MPSKRTWIVIIIVAILLIINSDRIFNLTKKLFPANQNLIFQTEKLTINNKTFTVEIADTPEKRKLGLSRRPALPADGGLLFVFDQPGNYGFWMKDMNFPIDIIWFNANKKIIGTTKNLRPKSYPQIFYPPAPIKYALEINPQI